MSERTGDPVGTEADDGRHWRGGLWFEDFVPGASYRHRLTRTVTQMDNILFCAMTHNPQPLHLDEEFSKKTQYGQRIVNSLFTLGLVIGFAGVAMLAWDKASFKPDASGLSTGWAILACLLA